MLSINERNTDQFGKIEIFYTTTKKREVFDNFLDCPEVYHYVCEIFDELQDGVKNTFLKLMPSNN